QIENWSASINGNTVEASMSGSPHHAEVLFQLLDLAFTAPRLDTAEVAKWRLETRQQKFEGSAIETLRATTQRHPRVRPVIGATVDSVDTTTVLRFYRESFGDAGHFTFVIVGDFNVDALRPLVEQYIGGLPGHPSATPYRGRDLGIRFPTGIVQRSTGTSDSTSTTMITFEAATPVTPHTQVVAEALSIILNQHILLRLRQQLSGAYSPGASCALQPIPYQHGICRVQFTSAPERAAELKQALFALIDTLRTKGVTAIDVQEARVIVRRTHEVDVQDNNFWMQELNTTVTAGESLDDLAAWEQQTQTVTATEINKLLHTLLTPTRYVQVTSLPVRMLPMRADEMRAALQW
ncbi:MAG TPA: insulinase family protein, partial [Gemmatimonadaceae bacterium]|nr:insulinase family protein [Gemmatimonadaceae bacterium]